MNKPKVKKIKLAKIVTCVYCDGDGEEPGAPQRPGEVVLCSQCEGKKTMPRLKAIRALADQCFGDEGLIEIDDNAKVSELATSENENGAYVQAWVWVDFDGHAGLDLGLG